MENLQVFSPYDGQFIEEVPLSSAEDVEQAMQVAYKAYQEHAQWLKPFERIAILEKVAELMAERKQDLAYTAAQEGGKPLMDSLVEADRAILGVKATIAHLREMHGRQVPMNITPSSENRLAYTYFEPRGVVFAISAFNHPLNLIVHQVIPAIATGCPVLIKPASSTPLSCFNLVNLLYEAGLPKQWCQVVACKSHVAEQFVRDSRVSFLSFIGSGHVGWYLRSILPPGAGCALEHGGAAPVLVEADADLEDALPLLAKGGFYHAGQVCVSVQRVFAQAKIAKSLAKQLAERAKQLKVGDPTDETTEVGPLIAKHEVERIHEWVHEAVYQGAKLMCGGEPISETCYAPTVLLDPPDDVRVSTQEIFGPVVCVYTYKHRLQAIVRANQLPFAFQAAVFTKDLNVALDSVQRLNATAVMVNDHTAFRVDWMPFGGRMQSGLGLGGIPYSMHDLVNEKMCVIRSSVL